VAWLAIAGVSLVVVAGNALAPRLMPSARSEEDAVTNLLTEIQAQYFVAAAESFGGGPMVYSQVQDTLNVGSVSQRQRFIVVAAHMVGREAAAEELRALRDLIAQERARSDLPEPLELSPQEERVDAILGALLGVDQVAAPGEEDRRFLTEALGWFGDLALLPHTATEAERDAVLAPGRRVMTVLLGAVAGAIGLGILGFAGLVVLAVLAGAGRAGRGLPRSDTHHGIYAETFAVWLGGFFGLQVLVGAAGGGPAAVGGAMFASLAALGWPVIRGIPWRRVRRDIGWTTGSRPALEPVLGLAGYAMALPLLALGVSVTLILILVQQMLTPVGSPLEPVIGPAHPVIAELKGGWWPRIQVLLLAAVAAPVVEETMFRGVLFRHLRDATRALPWAASFAASTLVTALVFAVIHPQGLVAVPALMGLASAFCILREWRGTLVGPMIMHAVSNGLLMTMLLFVLGPPG
jgi:membrane protease YdiL (CAAX protease family)